MTTTIEERLFLKAFLIVLLLTFDI
jgi:hypothetical protein